MEWEDFRAARDFLEKKSLGLMSHEKKNHATVGAPPQNFRIYHIRGRTFYAVHTNVFLVIMDSVLLEAVITYPEKFGTGEAHNVIEAIRLIEPTFEHERFVEFLLNEQFCYIIENRNGVILDKVLRIDLFRQLDVEATGKHEFTGGILHAFKHFSYNGTNLSTSNVIHDILRADHVIGLAASTFFFNDDIPANQKKFKSETELDDKHNLRFAFYYEENTGVYFINSIYKVNKKKRLDS